MATPEKQMRPWQHRPVLREPYPGFFLDHPHLVFMAPGAVYIPARPNPVVNPWVLGNQQRPIVVDSDSDDDVIVLSRPPTPPVIRPLPATEMQLERLKVQIPKVPDHVIAAYKDALRLEPGIIKDRLCAFLEQVLRSDRPIDNLLERIIQTGVNPNEYITYEYAREVELFWSFVILLFMPWM